MTSKPHSRSKSGQFQPGQSGNPGGRPRNPFGDLIRDKTKNGEEIVEKVLKILRSDKNSDVMWAAEWLRDTGWHKPAQGLRAVDDDGNGIDLSAVLTLTSQARSDRGLDA